jgi:hypothetical protein
MERPATTAASQKGISIWFLAAEVEVAPQTTKDSPANDRRYDLSQSTEDSIPMTMILAEA